MLKTMYNIFATKNKQYSFNLTSSPVDYSIRRYHLLSHTPIMTQWMLTQYHNKQNTKFSAQKTPEKNNNQLLLIALLGAKHILDVHDFYTPSANNTSENQLLSIDYKPSANEQDEMVPLPPIRQVLRHQEPEAWMQDMVNNAMQEQITPKAEEKETNHQPLENQGLNMQILAKFAEVLGAGAIALGLTLSIAGCAFMGLNAVGGAAIALTGATMAAGGLGLFAIGRSYEPNSQETLHLNDAPAIS